MGMYTADKYIYLFEENEALKAKAQQQTNTSKREL